jgi:hypothetical protein
MRLMRSASRSSIAFCDTQTQTHTQDVQNCVSPWGTSKYHASCNRLEIGEHQTQSAVAMQLPAIVIRPTAKVLVQTEPPPLDGMC